ncbi:hypothetical protein CO116_00310 [Candidatus Falkowbacteria bacterium CG_4_9_14_3_um_filter_38_19]|uniref:Methyltransferase domain-containing protein n=1 Tax=Candidatus Falkowbacteria bacterium CG_4_9_14_3_um_filter_38_19 TaxID=1974559 RepID=A0A2M8AK43_9BACT|nr:hypothetical protein [Candidatus Falkowbacteria bacterium]PJB18060.1 MAG: hypothetical protein CO116_00310 [Candidatus Falkowbacteria bacterium CG_4_9_14_3_um_filter_38_19]
MDLTILLIIILVLLLIIIFLAVQFFNIIFRGYAPFISTSGKVIKRIIEELNLAKGSRVYELGCGRAGFLHAACNKFAGIETVGIENDLLVYLISSIQAALTKHKIKIVKANFFKVDLSQADLIYCYLNVGTMAKLKDKLLKECKKGAQVVSYMFTLPDVNPDKTIKMGIHRIYFYTI